MPEAWAADRDRLRAAGVPEDVGYRPKWRSGLAMLARARANGLTGVVLADSAYGDVTEFRQELDRGRWRYCVGVGSTLVVVGADEDLGDVPPYGGTGRRPTRPAKVRAGAKAASVKVWAQERAAAFRRVTWREGS